MTQKKPLNHNDERGCEPPTAAAAAGAEEYKVGPGRPPKEHQFKPGVSGNPKGAKRKSPPIELDLKAALERALDKKVQLKQGERERTVSMAELGIEQLVAQFVRGDRHARRDLIHLADKLGVNLLAGHTKALENALAPSNEAILLAYLDRQYDTVRRRLPNACLGHHRVNIGGTVIVTASGCEELNIPPACRTSNRVSNFATCSTAP